MRLSPVKVWRQSKQITHNLGKVGKIVTYSLIRVAPKDYYQQAPYPVVIVEFKDRERMIGQLVDWREADIKIGKKVITVLRRARIEEQEDIIPYIIKFKPL